MRESNLPARHRHELLRMRKDVMSRLKSCSERGTLCFNYEEHIQVDVIEVKCKSCQLTGHRCSRTYGHLCENMIVSPGLYREQAAVCMDSEP